MEEKVKEYRQKHKKCKWCKWHNYHAIPPYMECAYYEECLLKDKYLTVFEPLQNIQAKFCKYYEVKEKEEKNKNEI